jgi:hypothetical protein
MSQERRAAGASEVEKEAEAKLLRELLAKHGVPREFQVASSVASPSPALSDVVERTGFQPLYVPSGSQTRERSPFEERVSIYPSSRYEGSQSAAHLTRPDLPLVGREYGEMAYGHYGRSHGYGSSEVRARPSYDFGYPETREVFPGSQYPPLKRLKVEGSGAQPETWRVGHIKNTLALVSIEPLSPEQVERMEFERRFVAQWGYEAHPIPIGPLALLTAVEAALPRSLRDWNNVPRVINDYLEYAWDRHRGSGITKSNMEEYEKKVRRGDYPLDHGFLRWVK